jgi:hypothetical protein
MTSACPLTHTVSSKLLAITLMLVALGLATLPVGLGALASQSNISATGRIRTDDPQVSTVATTELINYGGMTAAEVDTFITICADQGLTELTLRLNSFSEWSDQRPSSSYVAKAKELITAATAQNIAINIDLHTWYTTWDSYFRDSASNCENNRDRYLNYVEAAINAFDGFPVKAWMVLNEPQARTATTSENNFILDIIAAAKAVTSQPVSVRFMAGYSPTTGHYAEAIDEASDFLCRNTYWDPRNPGRSVYGTTEAKMNTVITYAKSVGKELWITEFGKTKNDLAEQRDYVAEFVEYSIEHEIDRIFCWVSQPEGGSGESYNIFTGYTPHPAFYELGNSS